MKIIAVFFVCIPALISCHTKKKQVAVQTAIADTAKFYPLAGFFKNQIEYVDLRNFPLYRIAVKDGKKDSAVLTKDAFVSWAGIFLERSLSGQGEKALYKETVFHDLSTGSYTINYTTADPLARVRNIDILFDEETNNLKRVFIKSFYAHADTSIEEQCNWKAGKSFQVNRSLRTPNGYTSTELNYINWNDTP